MFTIISIFLIPVLIIYCRGSAYADYKSKIISQFMVGNLGGSEMFCSQTRMVKREIMINCPAGTVIDSNNAVFGIMPSDFLSFSYCHPQIVK